MIHRDLNGPGSCRHMWSMVQGVAESSHSKIKSFITMIKSKLHLSQGFHESDLNYKNEGTDVCVSGASNDGCMQTPLQRIQSTLGKQPRSSNDILIVLQVQIDLYRF